MVSKLKVLYNDNILLYYYVFVYILHTQYKKDLNTIIMIIGFLIFIIVLFNIFINIVTYFIL